MLTEMKLKVTEKTLNISAEGITIFVGPNSSGKSLVLREIEEVIRGQLTLDKTKILDDFEIHWPDKSQFNTDIEAIRHEDNTQNIPTDHIQIGSMRPNSSKEIQNIHVQSILNLLAAKTNKMRFCNSFLKYFLIRLDGRTRFTLTNDQNCGDLQLQPLNILAKLFQDDVARLNVREYIFQALRMYFVIDPTNVGQLRIRLSNRAPKTNCEEQALDDEARNYHREAQYIKDASDGIQAYVGIVTSVFSGNYKTILIDEPEAFLFPPLARKLGNQLATIAKQYSGNLIAATHNSDFVMGCIQSGSRINIVRLEYKNGISRAIKIDNEELKELIEHPLIKSSNVLSSLFYDGVIITESDND